ncbi:MAG TPA: hypothetical protein PKA16_11305 [Ottowia sp.]|uniref:hypothetical protein n=1 Tax=Ottowia sp. TaxID=1898956 RepID=UPI002BC9E892|nr:hypothetical protein [Ottowia sp.]HMN21966.1 hypothetical protein [Ottowia sp.]
MAESVKKITNRVGGGHFAPASAIMASIVVSRPRRDHGLCLDRTTGWIARGATPASGVAVHLDTLFLACCRIP